jgi:hypothetical protein
MSGRSLCGPLPGILPGLVATALAVSALGCGAGFTVRPGGPVPIAASGRGPGAGPGPGTSESAAELLEHDHDDEPTAPAASDGTEDPDGLDAPAPASSPGTPAATRYGALDRATCEAELGRRKIAFERVAEARGVIAPVRLAGTIAGIDFHSMLPRAQRRTSPYEIYDCRLVLALDDWARVLARHDVVEVVHYSVYRPPPAKQVLRGPGRRHSGALAIDAAIFRTRDGQTLNVEKDFHGRIGGKPCAPTATSNTLPGAALELRKIVCEAADAQLFNVVLTPDYNRPHRNHFHLEVTAGVRWVLVR